MLQGINIRTSPSIILERYKTLQGINQGTYINLALYQVSIILERYKLNATIHKIIYFP